MEVIAILPARMASTRLPGKPLLAETGKPLIQHVYERVRQARLVTRVIVATDDDRIAATVASFGGEAVMTSPAHQSGTDRIAEVVRKLDEEEEEPANGCGSGHSDLAETSGPARDIILNVQGDEPEVEPASLDRLIERMKFDPRARMGTLATPFPPGADPQNPNLVKLVVNQARQALYFSRAAIPYERDASGSSASGFLLHVGVYAYRRNFLMEFSGWAPTRLEQLEKLEQLRALEHGVPIAVEVVAHAATGIDTPEQYAAFVQRWRGQSV
jgi:3-deoxy-manno-octulosonate cytidylyltransferase (CMP-KDO synthetase)